MDTNRQILFKDLSYKLQGIFYDVRNQYGQFHKEIIYHNALIELFNERKINFISEPRIEIISQLSGKKLGVYVPDFLIDDSVIVELKAAIFTDKNMEIQLLEYLKTTKYELAYLVNFGEEKFKPKRFIHTKDRKNLEIRVNS